MNTTELDPALRDSIDARLDAIDRVLLRVRTSYSERRHIVDEVGTQIFELLAHRGEQPTREDVAAVLASLDPPEAYVPEGYRTRLAETVETSVPRGPQVSLLAIGSAAGAILCLLLTGICAAIDLDEFGLLLLILILPALLVTAGGATAVFRILSSAGRLTGLPFALFATLLFPLLVGNQVFLLLIAAFDELGLWMLAGVGVLHLNYYCVRSIWRGLMTWRETLTQSGIGSRPAADARHQHSGFLVAART